jgi:hypothetical protein
MDRRIAPALVEKATGVVKGLEVVNVLLGAQPVKVTNLEVGPLAVLAKLGMEGAIRTKWQLL